MHNHTGADPIGSRKVRTVHRQRSFEHTGRVNCSKSAVESRQNAWSNGKSELLVHAPSPLRGRPVSTWPNFGASLGHGLVLQPRKNPRQHRTRTMQAPRKNLPAPHRRIHLRKLLSKVRLERYAACRSMSHKERLRLCIERCCGEPYLDCGVLDVGIPQPTRSAPASSRCVVIECFRS